MAYGDLSERRLHPDTRDNSILFMQCTHRSEVAWMEDPNYKSLNIRSGRLAGWMFFQSPLYLIYVVFVFLVLLRWPVWSSLVTAPVERWRPETQTFYMLPREVTVTLEDVAMITSLPTDGEPVTGMSKTQDFIRLVSQLLRRTPSSSDLRGGTLKTSWLDRLFTNVEDWMQDEEDLICFV
ncbi:serine/threonine-protein phosphatase 7 long form homolog [Gastrolobium bilobum]|uniref:serine/threonine-protein phosphatase 7 long form homolog n=1 Tax=Gastrolobium bilobum TaxID=150636 RepID=UPI002AB0A2E8|nr:serine/threonine-protein phosphatase 7 long form homolog [Gastrolobium bilobum]